MSGADCRNATQRVAALAVGFVAVLAAAQPARAVDAPESGAFTFVFENDTFARNDSDYTNGITLVSSDQLFVRAALTRTQDPECEHPVRRVERIGAFLTQGKTSPEFAGRSSRLGGKFLFNVAGLGPVARSDKGFVKRALDGRFPILMMIGDDMDMNRRKAIVTAASIAASVVVLSGCTTNIGATSSPEQKKAEIDKGADATLAMLYSTVPGSRELARKARGILIFPKIYAAAFGLGGEYGEGALRVGGRTIDYYSTAAASYGFQAGAQSKALVMMFMTQQALDKFRASDGWTVGADASVVVMKSGAQGTVDTTSVTADVHAFPLTNAGLMAGVSIDGSKVSKLKF